MIELKVGDHVIVSFGNLKDQKATIVARQKEHGVILSYVHFDIGEAEATRLDRRVRYQDYLGGTGCSFNDRWLTLVLSATGECVCPTMQLAGSGHSSDCAWKKGGANV